MIRTTVRVWQVLYAPHFHVPSTPALDAGDVEPSPAGFKVCTAGYVIPRGQFQGGGNYNLVPHHGDDGGTGERSTEETEETEEALTPETKEDAKKVLVEPERRGRRPDLLHWGLCAGWWARVC
ncbi:hypothetical protein PDE_06070 [Penicillium oxalicum 114-2]|uniref:Uncharacterized protein n=1 Tax=Penicillium oxalicum (strain 114-2 / CGMCC 5302) TaxID=933388 RepID=S7ZKE6_PENO1|nr:hypothetical protein PDE_06070 [Penicillium oxalicum 114-2]